MIYNLNNIRLLICKKKKEKNTTFNGIQNISNNIKYISLALYKQILQNLFVERQIFIFNMEVNIYIVV